MHHKPKCKFAGQAYAPPVIRFGFRPITKMLLSVIPRGNHCSSNVLNDIRQTLSNISTLTYTANLIFSLAGLIILYLSPSSGRIMYYVPIADTIRKYY